MATQYSSLESQSVILIAETTCTRHVKIERLWKGYEASNFASFIENNFMWLNRGSLGEAKVIQLFWIISKGLSCVNIHNYCANKGHSQFCVGWVKNLKISSPVGESQKGNRTIRLLVRNIQKCQKCLSADCFLVWKHARDMKLSGNRFKIKSKGL